MTNIMAHDFVLTSVTDALLPLVGGLPETQEMLDHCGKHGITSDIERITPARINEAHDRVVRRAVKYRFVIDCTKF